MVAAKNRAIDIVRRERRARTFSPELARFLETEWTLAAAIDESFEPGVVRDEQLRMMFSCCHPRLPEEAQLALILNILCGFGARAIGAAMLSGQAAIEKRMAEIVKKDLPVAREEWNRDEAVKFFESASLIRLVAR